MNNKLAVGTPVTVQNHRDQYLKDYGMSRDNLVVLANDGHGYGIGPVGNDPTKAHSRDGWIFFSDHEVTPKPDTRLAVGTPVTVENMYGGHGNNDLVVLSHDCNKEGYGIGPVGNDPAKAHSIRYGWLYYPASCVTPKEESKAVTEFNKGDSVQFKTTYRDGDTNSVAIGDKATVRGNGKGFNSNLIEVTLTSGKADGDTMLVFPWRLELAEEVKPFTFKDIQKGDTIRRTKTYKSGSLEVREGTVDRLTNRYAAEAGNTFILAYDSDDRTENTTLELLNRPKPAPEPVKEPYADAKVLTRKAPGDKHVDTFVKQEDGGWHIFYGDGDPHYTIRPHEKLGGYLRGNEVKVLVTV